MIDKNLIKKYCESFKGNYLKLNKFYELDERDLRFHAFGHWNIIHYDGKYIYHSYLNGGTGEIEETFSKTLISEIDDVIFIRHETVFMLFKYNYKTGLKIVYTTPESGTFEAHNKVFDFYHKNGIQVVKKILNMDMKTSKAYDYFDYYSGEKIN